MLQYSRTLCPIFVVSLVLLVCGGCQTGTLPGPGATPDVLQIKAFTTSLEAAYMAPTGQSAPGR